MDLRLTAIRELEMSMPAPLDAGACAPPQQACSLATADASAIQALNNVTVTGDQYFKQVTQMQLQIMALAAACNYTTAATLLLGSGAGGPGYTWDASPARTAITRSRTARAPTRAATISEPTASRRGMRRCCRSTPGTPSSSAACSTCSLRTPTSTAAACCRTPPPVDQRAVRRTAAQLARPASRHRRQPRRLFEAGTAGESPREREHAGRRNAVGRLQLRRHHQPAAQHALDDAAQRAGVPTTHFGATGDNAKSGVLAGPAPSRRGQQSS